MHIWKFKLVAIEMNSSTIDPGCSRNRNYDTVAIPVHRLMAA